MDFIIFFLLLLLTLTLALSVLATWWFGSLMIPLIAGGAPYVPTNWEQTKRMVQLANITQSDRVIDLGSGDGRLVIEAAKAGAAHACGIEIHRGLVMRSRMKARQQGVGARTDFRKESMWDADISDRTLVFLYQVPYAMKRLQRKLQHELPDGARIVSHGFQFLDWKPVLSQDNIFVYKKEHP